MSNGTRHSFVKISIVAGLAGLCGAASSLVLAQSEPINSSLHTFRVVTVVDGLVNPWSMAWLPNGDMLVTERVGTLRIIRDGKLLPTEVPGVPAVRAQGQGGMQEVAVHPNFAQNQFIYLSYSKPRNDNKEGTTALTRARLVNDRLVDAKLAAEGERILAEGWKWVSTSIDLPLDATRGMRAIDREEIAMTEAEEARLAALDAEGEELGTEWADVSDVPDEVYARLDAINAEIGALVDRPQLFDPADMASAGAFVSIDRDGSVRIERGFVKPEDEPQAETLDGDRPPVSEGGARPARCAAQMPD